MQIRLPKLRDWQKEALKNMKRFNVLVIHRRAGKTYIAITKLFLEAIQKPNDYGYVAPTYKQAKKIAWKQLKELCLNIPGVKTNEVDLTVTIPNGATITLFGADNPDSLRGLDLYGCVLDEYAQQPSSMYGEIIFPMINANKGWVLWIGTPKGKNSFFKLYERSIKDSRFYTLYLQASKSKLLDPEQLQDARDEMTEEEFMQEYELSWNAAIKGAVYGKEFSIANAEGRMVEGLYEPGIPVSTFWDIGFADATVALFVQVVGKEIRIIDHYKAVRTSLIEDCEVINSKIYEYDKHWFPHDIAVHDKGTGMARMSIVEEHLGYDKCDTIKKGSISGGINAGRIVFKDVWIDSRLEDLLNDLSLYHYEWDDKMGTFKKDPSHDFASHSADAYRYMATHYHELMDTFKGGVIQGQVDDPYGDDTYEISFEEEIDLLDGGMNYENNGPVLDDY